MSSARRPAALVRSLLLTLALGVSACLAPTLPIPPPNAPEVSAPDTNGEVTVKGGPGAAKPGATIIAVNQTAVDTDPACQAQPPAEAGSCDAYAGTPVHNDGSYSTQLKASSKDTIYVYQTIGTTSSDKSDPVSVP